MTKRKRHLTLITRPPPSERTLHVTTAMCCMPTVILDEYNDIVCVWHEDADDHFPDDAGIELAVEIVRSQWPVFRDH